jgi:hypothetical protein
MEKIEGVGNAYLIKPVEPVPKIEKTGEKKEPEKEPDKDKKEERKEGEKGKIIDIEV